MDRFVMTALLVAIAFWLITYFIHQLSKKRRSAKYLVPSLALILGGYNIYLAKVSTEGFADIAYILLAIIFLVGFLSSLLTSLFLDFILPKLKTNK